MNKRRWVLTAVIGSVLLAASLLFSNQVSGSGCVSGPAGPLTELSYSGSTTRGFPMGFFESGTSDIYCSDFTSVKAVPLVVDVVVWLSVGFGVALFFDRNNPAGKHKNE
jgi:hypothetical protein